MSENKTTPKDYYDKEMIEYIDNALGIGRAIKDIDKTLELGRLADFALDNSY